MNQQIINKKIEEIANQHIAYTIPEKVVEVDYVIIAMKDFLSWYNEHLIEDFKEMRTEFPEYESDDYDGGYKNAITDIISKLKSNV